MIRSKTVHLVFCLLVYIANTLPCFGETALRYKVIEKRAHDPTLFTQGFFIEGNTSYESSGLFGQSFVRAYETSSEEIIAEKRLSKNIFAEGITQFQNKLYLLTWKAGKALVLDPQTLDIIYLHTYQGEGWGITHDQKNLITSDGSHILSFRDPSTFNTTRTIPVHNRWRQYKHLNELEFAQSAIWANVWQSDLILKISPKDGQVLGIVNLKALAKENRSKNNQQNVLNGIAYDKQRDAFWVTGKFWPYKYLIEFLP